MTVSLKNNELQEFNRILSEPKVTKQLKFTVTDFHQRLLKLTQTITQQESSGLDKKIFEGFIGFRRPQRLISTTYDITTQDEQEFSELVQQFSEKEQIRSSNSSKPIPTLTNIVEKMAKLWIKIEIHKTRYPSITEISPLQNEQLKGFVGFDNAKLNSSISKTSEEEEEDLYKD